MDSPERTSSSIPPAEIEGSPIFNFLCSLSPIKPVKSLHVAQTYSELSFPPPPAIFVSPRVDTQKKSTSFPRNQARSSTELGQCGPGSCQVSMQTESRHLHSSTIRRVQQLQLVKRSKGLHEKELSLSSPCSSPSKLIEEYLAEPVEEENVVGSSELSHGDLKDMIGSDQGDCNKTPLDNVVRSSIMLHKLTEMDDAVTSSTIFCDPSVPDVSSRDTDDQQSNMDTTGLENNGLDSSKQVSTMAHHLSSQGSGDEIVLELDQETADLELFLSEGAEKDAGSPSELPMQEMTGYLATLKQIIDDDMQEAVLDSLSSQTSTSAMLVKHADGLEGAKVECELETNGGQQGEAVCRANMAPQRGIRRRCLDFEVSGGHWKNRNSMASLKSLHPHRIGRSTSAPLCDMQSNVALSVLKERALATSGATTSESPEVLDAHTADKVVATRFSRATSMVGLSRCSSLKGREYLSAKHENKVVSGTRTFATSPVPIGMPSGIGLHLNSLTGSMSYSQAEVSSFPSSVKCTDSLQIGSTSSVRQSGCISATEKTRLEDCEEQSQGSDQGFNAPESTILFHSATLGNRQVDDVTSVGPEKPTSPTVQKRMLLPDVAHQVDLDVAEDSSQSPRNSKKKRKSTSTTEKSGDGCKRCNCKKSKCLKLYCECFAAGVYCVDSCSCHDCFNKPEFEDTVLGTRQQIESRNPLAFAPKIVRAADSSPTNGEDCGDTPASARHKRGCNCKKSQCLKKYCECYQAGVGCSDGCRCEGCKNLFGRKEGSEECEDKDSQAKILDKDSAEEQFDASDFGHDLNQVSQHRNFDLSPITPSFQCAGQSRSTAKSRSATKRRFSSEELHSPAFSLSSAKPPRSPSRLLRSSKGEQNSSTLASTGLQASKMAGSPLSTPKILRIGQFSPRWDGLGDICTLTPLPQAPLRPTPASTSVLDGADSSPSFNGQQCNELLSSSGNISALNNSKILSTTSPTSQHRRASSGSISNPPFETPSSIQSAPVTPNFTSLGMAGNKPQLAGMGEDDGTPDFLRDQDPVCSPGCILKTSSPKQKRVSPPHNQSLRETSHRGLRSPGLRSGRKFILQSIPSVTSQARSIAHEQATGHDAA